MKYQLLPLNGLIAFESAGHCIALIQQRFLGQYLESKRLVMPLDITMDMEQAIYLVQP
jgi:hypothetical protein